MYIYVYIIFPQYSDISISSDRKINRGMANSINPDHTAPLGADELCDLGLDLFAQIFRVNTEITM